ncbi:hypothetical protein Tco_0031380 [Tanacetum coccineum]
MNEQKKDNVKEANGSTVVGSTSMFNEPVAENNEDTSSLTAKIHNKNVKCLKVHIIDPCTTTPGFISGVKSSHKQVENGSDAGNNELPVVVESAAKTAPTSDKVDIQVPRSSVLEANARFKNSLYGYFLVMMNANDFFFFKFSSSKGRDGVLENGPWMIRNPDYS